MFDFNIVHFLHKYEVNTKLKLKKKYWAKGPSTKYVRKFFPIFDPYPPHVCNRLHFKDPSLKRMSANREFDPPPPFHFFSLFFTFFFYSSYLF